MEHKERLRKDDLCQEEFLILQELRDRPRDAGVRLVYQDWLEERGDERAEYLRLIRELSQTPRDTPEYQAARGRLRKLRGRLQKRWKAWLTQVSQASIEYCDRQLAEDEACRKDGGDVEFAFACPLSWDRLHNTEDETVRFCDQCRRHVFFCQSVPDANRYPMLGACVAIDESLPRSTNDVTGQHRVMGKILPPKRLMKYRRIEREQS